MSHSKSRAPLQGFAICAWRIVTALYCFLLKDINIGSLPTWHVGLPDFHAIDVGFFHLNARKARAHAPCV